MCWRHIPELRNYTTYKNNIHISTHAYKNLISEMNNISPKFKAVVKRLNYLYDVYKDKVDQKNREINETVAENSKFYGDNFPWYNNSRIESRKEKTDYMMSSWEYKNDVIRYRAVSILDLLDISMTFRQEAVNCYQDIAQLLNKPLTHNSFQIDSTQVSNLLGTWTTNLDPESKYFTRRT